MLALEKREFIYEFNYEIKQPSSHLNLVDFQMRIGAMLVSLKS